MIGFAVDDRELSTTSGTIAVVNLHAQIDGLGARLRRSVPEPSAAAVLREPARPDAAAGRRRPR
jgi:hypothetical protein